ncbi:MAG: PilZ domain-containing protein [bacterium]
MSMEIILKLGFSAAICIPILIIVWVAILFIRKQMFGPDEKRNVFIQPDAIGVERRQYERVDVAWPVIMETSEGVLNTETVNISLSGAFIICQKPLPIKEIFPLTINIPNNQSLSMTAEVVWSNSNISEDMIVNRGMGIRFLKISKEDRQLLNNVLQNLHSQKNETINLKDMPLVERRQHERYEITWPVKMETSQGTMIAETKDISISGAFIMCQQPLPLNENFTLAFTIPNHDPIELNAEVIWTNINVPADKIVKRGMGVRYIQVSEEVRHHLLKALKEYTQASPESDKS